MARVYESRTNRALVHNYFIARKYYVLSRYIGNNYINVFLANTFFNNVYQTLSGIKFIATGRVAPVTGYKNNYTQQVPFLMYCGQTLNETRHQVPQLSVNLTRPNHSII